MISNLGCKLAQPAGQAREVVRTLVCGRSPASCEAPAASGVPPPTKNKNDVQGRIQINNNPSNVIERESLGTATDLLRISSKQHGQRSLARCIVS